MKFKFLISTKKYKKNDYLTGYHVYNEYDKIVECDYVLIDKTTNKRAKLLIIFKALCSIYFKVKNKFDADIFVGFSDLNKVFDTNKDIITGSNCDLILNISKISEYANIEKFNRSKSKEMQQLINIMNSIDCAQLIKNKNYYIDQLYDKFLSGSKLEFKVE